MRVKWIKKKLQDDCKPCKNETFFNNMLAKFTLCYKPSIMTNDSPLFRGYFLLSLLFSAVAQNEAISVCLVGLHPRKEMTRVILPTTTL